MIDHDGRSAKLSLDEIVRRGHLFRAFAELMYAAQAALDLPGDVSIEPRFTRVTVLPCGDVEKICLAIPGGSMWLSRDEGFQLALAIALASTAINTDDGEKQE